MLGSGLNNGLDPTQVDQEVQSALRRPVLTIVCIVAFFAFAVWYFTGGSANGSSHQAEQLILTNTNPYGGNFTNGANVQTVNCTQEGQSLAARLRGFISPGTNHGSSQSPLTYNNCSGTTTSGAPMQWCVIYPPQEPLSTASSSPSPQTAPPRSSKRAIVCSKRTQQASLGG